MSDFNKHHKRIAKILGGVDELQVTYNTLRKYIEYLNQNISLPCNLTGIEDFSWEEFYILGPGDEEEYEHLKKTRASYTDTFELLCHVDEIDEHYGILASVKRISDNKKFIIPLEELKATDKHSNNYRLFHDYSVWFVNYH